MSELNSVNEPKWLTRSPLPAADWDTFPDLVQKAMALHIQSYGVPGQKAPLLTKEFPKANNGNFDTSFDVILFHIAQSVKAGTDPSGKRRLPKGPNRREVKPHPTKARYSLVTVGWWELMTVRFTILSLSHDRADEITSWFHRMMMRYTFFLDFFRANGVQYMTFNKRGEDKFNKEYGQELYERTLEYDVRLEILQTYEIKDFESVTIQLAETPDIILEEKYPVP